MSRLQNWALEVLSDVSTETELLLALFWIQLAGLFK